MVEELDTKLIRVSESLKDTDNRNVVLRKKGRETTLAFAHD